MPEAPTVPPKAATARRSYIYSLQDSLGHGMPPEAHFLNLKPIRLSMVPGSETVRTDDPSLSRGGTVSTES